MCHERPFVERPICSSTSAHSTWLQPWPPCSTACRPPFRRASSAARRMALDLGRRQHAARALGHLLARDQHVVDEAPRARLQLGLGRGQPGRPAVSAASRSLPGVHRRHRVLPGLDRRHGAPATASSACRAVSRRRPPPGSPSSRPAWLRTTSLHDRRGVRDLRVVAAGAPARRAPPPRAASARYDGSLPRRTSASARSASRAASPARPAAVPRGAARRSPPGARAPAPGSARARPAKKSAHARRR